MYTDASLSTLYKTQGNITDENYTTEVNLDTRYWWIVEVNDGTVKVNSSVFNFTLESYESITFTTNTINFSTKGTGDRDNTTDNNPPPFVIENTGNVLVNLTINATTLWTNPVAGLGTNYYQFKAAETTETGAFNTGTSQINWTNMTITPINLIKELNYTISKDEAEIDLLVEVPNQEPAGEKTSTIKIST